MFHVPLLRRVAFHARRIGSGVDRHFFITLLTAAPAGPQQAPAPTIWPGVARLPEGVIEKKGAKSIAWDELIEARLLS